MSLIEPLLIELERESATPRRVFERVPADKFGWKPHPKAKSLGQLAAHIALVPRAISEILKNDVHEMAPPPTPELQSREQLLALFDESLAAAKQNLAAFSDVQMNATWSLVIGGKKIFAMPRAAVGPPIILNPLYPPPDS